MRQQTLVDEVRDEGHKRCQCLHQCEKNVEKCVQSMLGVFETRLSLESSSIELNVPIGDGFNEGDKTGRHSI